jgi:hypothetical protein
MTLPKLSTPVYTTTLPSNGKKITYRPFLVKEEKLLMISGNSENPETIIANINQVLKNCVQNKDFDPEQIPAYDAQWLFLKLREVSIGEVIHASVKCPITGQYFDSELELKNAKVIKDEKRSDKIIFEQGVGITLRDVTLRDVYLELDKLQTDEYSAILNLVKKSIVNIFDSENVYEAKDIKSEDLEEFIENLKKEHFAKLTEYFVNIPKIRLEQELFSPLAEKQVKLVLENFMDFFA